MRQFMYGLYFTTALLFLPNVIAVDEEDESLLLTNYHGPNINLQTLHEELLAQLRYVWV